MLVLTCTQHIPKDPQEKTRADVSGSIWEVRASGRVPSVAIPICVWSSGTVEGYMRMYTALDTGELMQSHSI